MARHETEMHRHRRMLREALEQIIDLCKADMIENDQRLETIRELAEQAIARMDAR